MRLYIYKITKHTEEQKPDTIGFTKHIADAWYWTTKEAAEAARHRFSEGGITVTSPFGANVLCAAFRVEARQEGGFAISCEYPFANE